MTQLIWIAEQSFRCVTLDAKVLNTLVRIAAPDELPAEGSRHAYARCRLEFEPLAANRWIAANNGFQALCLALDHVRTVFKVFVAEGGRVYWEDTDSHVDLNSPWFAPMPSLSDLRRGST